jgi:phospholipid/cholesterol/gamma-HCH transport system substrate-binding protein
VTDTDTLEGAMTEHGNELRVGVTLTGAAAALILGVLWLGGFKFGEERYDFSIVFPEVSGLVAGDKVTVAGIPAGEVLGLQLANGQVVVDVSVDSAIKIPVDSRISVASYGLIGAKNVAVRPGSSGVYIGDGQTVFGQYDKGLGDVVAEMGEALTEIRGVLKAADQVITDVEGKERVKTTLMNASEATADLTVAVRDLKAMAAQLRAFVEEKQETAATAIDSLDVASARFARVTADLEQIASTLDSILGRVERGEGSLGKLIGDEEAHDEFVAAIREVRALVAEIQRNPKSFVRFSIF